MKILFVSSGNRKDGISPIVLNQGKSLQRAGIHIDFFTIKGKGIRGYLKNVFLLRSYLKKSNYNLIHAHYKLSAFIVSLALARPLVVSLMGSDVLRSKNNWILHLFSYFSWNTVIVKSQKMKDRLGINKAQIIPNGVNFKLFYPIDQKTAQEKLGWSSQKKYVLFPSNPRKVVKNYNLAQESIKLVNDDGIELITTTNVPNDEMVYYYNSADVVILTSHSEGSPNVIKEAMACCRPIVSVDVGDVSSIISNTEGCYTSSREPTDLAANLKKALQFSNKTNGRDRISHLKEELIASRIIKSYRALVD